MGILDTASLLISMRSCLLKASGDCVETSICGCSFSIGCTPGHEHIPGLYRKETLASQEPIGMLLYLFGGCHRIPLYEFHTILSVASSANVKE